MSSSRSLSRLSLRHSAAEEDDLPPDYDSAQKTTQQSYVIYSKLERVQHEVERHRKLLEELWSESLLEEPPDEDVFSTTTPEVEKVEARTEQEELSSVFQLRQKLRSLQLKLEEAGRRIVAQEMKLEARTGKRQRQRQGEAAMTQSQQKLAELRAKVKFCREKLQQESKVADAADRAGQRRDKLRRLLQQRSRLELAQLEKEFRRTEKLVELQNNRQTTSLEESKQDLHKKGELLLKEGLCRWGASSQ